MTTKSRNLVAAAGILAMLILFLWQTVPSGPTAEVTPLEMTRGPAQSTPTRHGASPSSTIGGPDLHQTPSGATGSRTYSIGLHELSGLTERTPPGTRIDIWASWGPPITKKPHVQRLLRDVTVVEIAPPFIPEGPVGVVLEIAPEQAERMVWGDKYGSLAAVVIE